MARWNGLWIAALLWMPALAAAEPLYFSIEIRREGRLVAHPRLLGEANVTLLAERRPSGSGTPDYQLRMDPQRTADRYRIALDLRLPDRTSHSRFEVAHGEEKSIELGKRPGDLEVKLLLLRVDSPEFDALMRIAAQPRPLSI